MYLIKRPAQCRQRGSTYFPLLIILAAFSILLIGSWLGFSQSPRPDPYTPINFSDKFLYPIETNAFKRLPKISPALNSVYALPDSNRVWAVGYNGLIIHSSDGGITWQQQTFPEGHSKRSPNKPDVKAQQQNLLDFFVSNAKAGEVQSQEKSISNSKNISNLEKQNKPVTQAVEEKKAPEQKTTKPLVNKKEEFVKQPERIEKPNLKRVFFIDNNHGWAVGQHGTIVHTEDGGLSWQAQNSGSKGWLSSVTFTNTQRGWAVGEDGTVVHTEDGGFSWQAQSSGTKGWLASVTFTDTQRGWAVSFDGTIVHTEDGGLSWQAQSNGSKVRLGLDSVTFADTQRGWAVGFDGTILHTEDGGLSWQAQSSGTKDRLDSVTFTDTQRGWAVGRDGTIVHTEDGGLSWQAQSSGSKNRLNSVTFTGPQRGWAVGDGGTIVHTEDGGLSWQAQSSGTKGWLTSVTFTDTQRGWAVGSDDTILHTEDGGLSWQAQSSGSKNRLHSVTFTDTQRGWAVGNDGTVVHTEDGGFNWQAQSSGSNNQLASVTFTDTQRGWAVGQAGTVVHTEDGGFSWQAQSSGSINYLASVTFTDTQHGWAVGMDGTILHTEDGGLSWQAQSNGSKNRLNSVTFTGLQRGWAVGLYGTILHTEDGGLSWQTQNSGSKVELYSVTFIDPQRGWAVGDNGTIVHTEDGGLSWQEQNSRTKTILTSVTFTDTQRGWAVGNNGTVVHTENGGKTWNSLDYKRYPAGWYYLLCFLVLIITWLALNSRQEQTDKQETITDLLASDRPLQKGDPDPLGFTEIALGLSRFIRNPRTEPPLTIAITGKWGTGKSSLMNLLHEDLQDKGFSTVWFNAWHHQKSEQLLATLFANIRRQAIPGWFRVSGFMPVGLLFRLRLLICRSRRHWLLFLLMVFVFSAAVAYICAERGHFTLLMNWLNSHLTTLSNQVKIVFALGATGATLLPLLVFIKSLQGFALNPLKLMTVHAGEGQKASSVDPGARYQFAREFKDVTSSLDLGRMIIFIDDLDRCGKENVLEILEAINFLVTSGNCYIILGMAREWVQICVGLSFKELASESFSNNHADSKIDPIEHRRLFALQYMEKMINIEVPVPVLDESKAQKLTVPEKTLDTLSTFDKIHIKVSQFFSHKWPMLVFITMIALGGYLGITYELPPLKLPKQDEKQSEILSVRSAADMKSTGIVNPLVKNDDLQKKSTAGFIAGAENTISWPKKIPYFLILVILIAGLVLMFRKPDRIVEDSKSFQDALKIWQEWLLLRKQTPRTIKRFLNHLRYMAMRYRNNEEPRNIWQRWKNTSKQNQARQSVFTEPALVALSVLHYIEPSWVADAEKFKQLNQLKFEHLIADIKIDKDSDSSAPEKLRKQFVKTIENHKVVFQVESLATEEQRELFLSAVSQANVDN